MKIIIIAVTILNKRTRKQTHPRQFLTTQTFHTRLVPEVAARGSPIHAPITCLPRSARLVSPPSPTALPPPPSVCSTRPSNCSISASSHRTRLPHYVSAPQRPRQVREGRFEGGSPTGNVLWECCCTRTFSSTYRIQYNRRAFFFNIFASSEQMYSSKLYSTKNI